METADKQSVLRQADRAPGTVGQGACRAALIAACAASYAADALLQGYDRSAHLDAVLESRGEEIAVGIERAAAFDISAACAGSIRPCSLRRTARSA